MDVIISTNIGTNMSVACRSKDGPKPAFSDAVVDYSIRGRAGISEFAGEVNSLPFGTVPNLHVPFCLCSRSAGRVAGLLA